MNEHATIIKLLIEIRDLLKNSVVLKSKPKDIPHIQISEKSDSQKKETWEEVISKKKTENVYYITALAVYYKTICSGKETIKKSNLIQFLSDNVVSMNGKKIDTIIKNTVSTYGYIGVLKRGEYKSTAVTKEIYKTLPEEDILKKKLTKKYKNKIKSKKKK